MKTAVLIFGMLREFDSMIPSWKLDEYLSCDYYISTWKKSRQKYNFLEKDVPENVKQFEVTEDLIKSVLPNCVCDIKNEEEIFVDNTDLDSNDPAALSIRQAKMFYHWKNLYRMLEESGKTYDLIILLRPDTSLRVQNLDSTTTNILENWTLEQDVLYCDSLMFVRGMSNGRLQYLSSDILFCGSFNMMQKFFNIIPDISIEENKYKSWIPHVSLGELFTSNNIYPSEIHPFKVFGVHKASKKTG
jgi:hypothetical protein